MNAQTHLLIPPKNVEITAWKVTRCFVDVSAVVNPWVHEKINAETSQMWCRFVAPALSLLDKEIIKSSNYLFTLDCEQIFVLQNLWNRVSQEILVSRLNEANAADNPPKPQNFTSLSLICCLFRRIRFPITDNFARNSLPANPQPSPHSESPPNLNQILWHVVSCCFEGKECQTVFVRFHIENGVIDTH